MTDSEYRRLIEFLGEQFTRIDTRFDQIDARLAQVDGRFGQNDGRFAEIDRRFGEVDRRFADIDRRLEALDARQEERFREILGHFDELTGASSVSRPSTSRSCRPFGGSRP